MSFSSEQLARWQLIRTPGIGPVAYRRLLALCGSARQAVAQLPDLASQYKRAPLQAFPLPEVEAEAEQLLAAGGTALFLDAPDYPRLLSYIADPPPLLQVLGNPQHLSDQALAVVGTRNASAAGHSFTKLLAEELASHAYLIVSGLARGIDTAAHKGALSANQPTLAVVAGGANHLYPPENKDLRQRIIEHGCLVSEAPWGTTPTARHFPRRNRIISGLARGVIVTEAGRHSGSLITATYAGEQGRDVFAMPGNPADPNAAGPNHLIKQGAYVLETAADVLASLSLNGAFKPASPVAYSGEKPAPDLFATSLFPSPAPHTDGEDLAPDLPTTPCETIERLLSSAPVALDNLIRQSGLAEAEAIIALTELELDGKIKRHTSGAISRS
jgi:DNA processing protein